MTRQAPKPSALKRIVLGGVLGVAIAGGLIWVGARFDQDTRQIWRTDGYGMIFDLTGPMATVYEQSGPYCLQTMRFPALKPVLRYGKGGTITTSKDQLRLDVAGDYGPIRASAIDSLPTACTSPTARDPETVFEMIWHAMNEHYAFFDLYDVDWQDRYATYRPQVTAATTDDALFSVVTEMLTGLEDGHLFLNTQGGRFSPEISPEWIKDKPAIKAVLGQMELTDVDGAGLSYGWLPDQVGYIRLKNMTIKSLSPIHAAGKAEQAMSKVLAALEGAQGIVLDNRWNPGGSDDISLAYAGFFAAETRPAFSKETRIGDHIEGPTGGHNGDHSQDRYGPRTNVSLMPSITPGFTGPVVLLNSGFTASAAEIFTMAMQDLPNVTVMGEATSGAHSDILDRALPNGWSLGLSHQRYYAADGKIYEDVGLSPDLPRAFDRDGFTKGVDTLLNEAQALLSPKS